RAVSPPMWCSLPLTRSRTWSLQPNESAIGLRPPVTVELPGVAHFADLLQVELRGDQRVFVALGLGHELAARVAEVALSVELADVPRRLVADAVDGADEVAVGHGVRRLLELPEVFGESGHGGRRIEDDLRAVQPQLARSLGEVAVVADVDADLRIFG